MTSVQVFEVMNQALLVTLSLAGPLIAGTLAVGLVVSIFQAATQINEATLSFAPKLIVVAGMLVVLGPWMLDQLITFTTHIFEFAAQVGRGA